MFGFALIHEIVIYLYMRGIILPTSDQAKVIQVSHTGERDAFKEMTNMLLWHKAVFFKQKGNFRCSIWQENADKGKTVLSDE